MVIICRDAVAGENGMKDTSFVTMAFLGLHLFLQFSCFLIRFYTCTRYLCKSQWIVSHSQVCHWVPRSYYEVPTMKDELKDLYCLVLATHFLYLSSSNWSSNQELSMQNQFNSVC